MLDTLDVLLAFEYIEMPDLTHAAQYKFGARGGAACVVLGGMKTTLGLLFGSSVAGLLAAFPQPLLGALLTLAGVELAMSVQHTRYGKFVGRRCGCRFPYTTSYWDIPSCTDKCTRR